MEIKNIVFNKSNNKSKKQNLQDASQLCANK